MFDRHWDLRERRQYGTGLWSLGNASREDAPFRRRSRNAQRERWFREASPPCRAVEAELKGATGPTTTLGDLPVLSRVFAVAGVASCSLAVSLTVFGIPSVGFEMAGLLGGICFLFGFAALLGGLVAESVARARNRKQAETRPRQ